MKDATTTFDSEQYTTILDKQLKKVMPDTWVGHARLALSEYDLSDEQQAKVLQHTQNIAQEKEMPAETVATKVIEKLGYE